MSMTAITSPTWLATSFRGTGDRWTFASGVGRHQEAVALAASRFVVLQRPLRYFADVPRQRVPRRHLDLAEVR
jgi:hypothetical protein